jgi:uncharacterized Ntn-hydrolase superfamily protein
VTYSITGRCPRTGDVGLALATFSFIFGPMQDAELKPTWWVARRDAGAVTCQAETRFGFAVKVFERLRVGESAPAALETAIVDEASQFFQVAVVDSRGHAAAFTGGGNLDWKGHLTGDGWAAAGNILVGGQVVQAMGQTFEERPDLDLPERLLAALSAGRDAGGDRRGTRNAVLQVASENVMGGLAFRAWEQDDPIAETARLVALARPLSEFWTLAQQAARRFAELLPGSGLDLAALLPLSLREAAERTREAWEADPRATPADLDLADRFLASLYAQSDMAEQKFGPAISLLPSMIS